jgi:penicillin-binding protein 2
MLAALIALEEGIISTETQVVCKGGFKFGDRFFKCHGVDGAVNVLDAIEHSCNTFFYKLILDIGLERWAKYLRMFGFGYSTEVDIGGDSKGIVPDSEYYNKKFGKRNWGRGNLVSLGIGQGELSVTTLQLAQYASLLANFGKTKVPHIGKGYVEDVQSDLVPFKFKDKVVPISRKNFDIVRKGMYNVVNRAGTATHIRLPEFEIAGKTGTSQNPHGKDHALFIGFAPYDNPKIAIACIVENVGFGGTYAAPIAQRLIKAYLSNLDDDEYVIKGEK